MNLRTTIAVNYAAQIWVALLGFAFLPLYIQYLGIEAYGLVGLFIAMQAWITLLDMGMTPALSREMARFTAGAHTPQSIRDLLRSIEIIALGLASVIAGVLIFLSGWLASDWLKADKLPLELVGQSISIMGIVVALRFVEGIYRGSLLGLQQQIWYNGASVGIASLRQLVIVVVLVYVSPTITAFFVCQAVFSLLTVLALAYKTYLTIPVAMHSASFSMAAIRSIWRFAGGIVLITFLAILLTQVDKILLSKMLSLESFGYYTLAGAVSTIIYMIVGPITQAIYPRMVELFARHDEAALTKIYHQGAQLVTVLTGPAVMLLVFYSDGVLLMWSGNSNLVASTAPILSVLAFGTFLNGLMYMPYHLQLTHGLIKLSVITNSVAVAMLVPAMFYVVPTHGAKGAAWIWVALNVCYVLVVVKFLLSKLLSGEQWTWLVRDILVPLGAATVVCATMTFFVPVEENRRIKWFIFLLLTGAMATLAALISADTLRATTLQHIRALPRHLMFFSSK